MPTPLAPLHCRHCGATLPASSDGRRVVLASGATIARRWWQIACPACGTIRRWRPTQPAPHERTA